jgi:hypothetical protein
VVLLNPCVGEIVLIRFTLVAILQEFKKKFYPHELNKLNFSIVLDDSELMTLSKKRVLAVPGNDLIFALELSPNN